MNDLSGAAVAIATLGSVIVAIVATVAARRSAIAAEHHVKHAEKAERLRIERELALAAQRAIAGSLSAIDTGELLQIAYISLYALLGQSDSSEHLLRHRLVEKRKESAHKMQGEANALLERRATWVSNLDDELVAHLTTMEGYAVQLERARLRLARDLEKYEGLVRMHGEIALKKQPPMRRKFGPSARCACCGR
jgi:hypothetical protein